MSRINQIAEIAETITISKKPVTLKLSAWPYSRTIIKAICENNMIDLKINRLSKDHEEFVIGAVEDAAEKFKNIMSLVNKEAKESGNKVTAERNVIADKICKKLGVTLVSPVKKEVVKKPVAKKEKVAPKAKKLTAPKATKKVSLKTLKAKNVAAA